MATISQRMLDLPISSIRRLTPYAQKAKEEGVNILHLNIGEPDLEAPEVMIDALRNWSTKHIPYAPSVGTPEFIAALVKYYEKLGLTEIKSSHILATTAGSEAISMALFAVADPDAEVLLFEPFYSTYKIASLMCGLQIKTIETRREEGFHLPDMATFEAAITPKTRAILYSSPGNPTGAVYTRREIEMLVQIAKKHDLFIIADEVYREYSFASEPCVSIMEYMDEIPDKVIVVDSLSKRYSLCGARLGCIVSKNEEFMKGVLKIAMSRLSGSLIDQHIGAQLVHVPQSYIENIRREYTKRRDIVYQALKTIPGVEVTLPEGAFYAFVKLPVKDAQKFCIWLLASYRMANETVMLAPGCGFYSSEEKGTDMVRIAYVLEENKLKKAMKILSDALLKYRD